MGRLTSQHLSAGARALHARAYGYRSDGCLERVTDELRGTSRGFDLDPVGRPLRVTAEDWAESYAYDSAGSEISAEWPDQAARDGGGAGMGPAIRMDAEDHRELSTTGSGKESDEWRAKQRKLIGAGRWDQAMKMDIDEIRDLYGDKSTPTSRTWSTA
ncbi:YD repeat-containing protein [Streptomyces sp. 2231.1]|uniref:hypothetical protein n=1 Tax=Streptomyces sp. 2231.1 TaxID=1855347 RepID=UPI000896EE03|nr:hypothetical protein [Streptomyces sp. 2231.1]SEE03784.1 YD repeat-containing protein [Streptomyces sp. 2231.1]